MQRSFHFLGTLLRRIYLGPISRDRILHQGFDPKDLKLGFYVGNHLRATQSERDLGVLGYDHEVNLKYSPRSQPSI